MGWGVSYKYEGYLSRTTISQLEYEKEELETINSMLWEEILSYMASTPTELARDSEDGDPIIWQEFITLKYRELKKEILENEYKICHINDCLEAMHENKDNVKDT